MAQFQPVISTRYPYLETRVGIRGWQDDEYALIDTGFDGNLVLPADLLTDDLGLPDGHIRLRLADGGIVDASLYMGNIEIPGIPVIDDVFITFLATNTSWAEELSIASR